MLKIQQAEFDCTLVSNIPIGNVNRLPVSTVNCCCGLDIHKESIVACLLAGPVKSKLKPQSEIREFGTQLWDLLALRRWLGEHKCHHVAMESTGIYWQPVYAVLETALSDEMHLLVVNARHMKNVPGKKTDMRDAEWIARYCVQVC